MNDVLVLVLVPNLGKQRMSVPERQLEIRIYQKYDKPSRISFFDLARLARLR